MTLVQCESNILIDWFYFNEIQANPDRFQAIAVGKPTFSRNPYFIIGNSIITCDKTVKPLGIDIDYKLNFDTYIQSICKKAVTQINVIKRGVSPPVLSDLVVKKNSNIQIYNRFLKSEHHHTVKTHLDMLLQCYGTL